MAVRPVALNELIFSEASHNFSQVLSSLKRSKHSIKHRLASIYEDSEFVTYVADELQLPLIANERCGSWYIRLEDKAGSVYFKSTDGHHGQWSFNTRRLNLHLLETIEKNEGCIIIDSTRRGKTTPDALSKTIPIWCAVMNRLLFPDQLSTHTVLGPEQSTQDSPRLHSPISASERAQINARLPIFLKDLQALNLPLPNLQAKLSKPLQQLFLTPSSHLSGTASLPFTSQSYHPIILCTASRQETGDNDDGYIQGAGDDTEMWAHGLTAEAFWRNREYLMVDTSEEELQGRIREVMEREKRKQGGGFQRVAVGKQGGFWVGKTGDLKSLELGEFDGLVLCNGMSPGVETVRQSPSEGSEVAEEMRKAVMLELGCPSGKYGSKMLREKLQLLKPFIERACTLGKAPKLLFVCETGKDLCIGVALVVNSLYYDDEGNFTRSPRTSGIDKAFIRQRLVTILNQLPGVNPARATLQSVNSFLIERPG